MRSNTLPLVVILAAGLLMLAPATSRGQAACNNTAPVIARPVDSQGGFASQFTFVVPAGLTVTGANHWMLVDDFVENFSFTIRSGFINTNATTTKTELYAVANPNQFEGGLQFASCRIRAQLMANGSSTTVHLAAKQGGIQSDGDPIVVIGQYLQEYQRNMATNPISGLPWTSDDLANGTFIGVKNVGHPNNWGAGIESIMLQCE